MAQGKYYVHINEEFKYPSGDGWYANPNISLDYVAGTYKVRSIYIRSSENEYVHYSIESGNLPEDFQDTTIELVEKDNSLFGTIKDVFVTTPDP